MKRILVIDNHIDPPDGSPELTRNLRQVFAAGEDIPVKTERGPEVTYSLDTEDLLGVVISGSKTCALDSAPWIDTQMEFVRKLRQARVPTLGICYGEQLMARAFGGVSHVRTAPTCEFGFVRLKRTPEGEGEGSAILAGLPREFYSFCYHYDEVQKLPAGFVLTAFSDDCAIHCIEAEDAPMWGVQFHPEKDLGECRKSMAHIQKADPKVPLLNAAEAEKLYDPGVARTIFANFLKAVRKYRG